MSVRAFIISVAVGTIATSSLPVVMMLLLASLGDEHNTVAIGLSLFGFEIFQVIALVYCGVLAGALIIGLPVTLVLDKLRLASERSFMAMGGMTALLTLVAIFWAEGDWKIFAFFACSAVPGGIVAGGTWYRLRSARDD